MKCRLATLPFLLLLHAPLSAAQECLANASIPGTVSAAYTPSPSRDGEVVFHPGADGTLRAVDERVGHELWSFTPPQLDITHRADGLMSSLRILRYDANLDGTLDAVAGDRLWLYFGMRRGGRDYYALEATDRHRARLLWRAGPAELPGIGETWSTPVTARVRVSQARQNGEHLVMIAGGGYDEAAASAHRIYMLDAATGALLWYAGGPAGIETPRPPDLALARMTSPFPGRIAVIDVDGDGFADRMYAGDAGGRLWRFDIWNGQSRSGLVTGGILASLGADGSALPSEARRFFNGPDVALIRRRDIEPYFNIAIGSGDRAQPFGTEIHDRLYSIRDHDPFARLSQAAYDERAPIVDADLVDITDRLTTAAVPEGAAGWMLELRTGGSWLGEKALAEAVTANGTILYITFEPAPGSRCADSGRNRVYALRLEQGHPALDLDDDGRITDSDSSAQLEQHGIAGEVELQAPRSSSDGNGEPPVPDEEPGDYGNSHMRCVVGAETLRFCVSVKSLQRTFWQRRPPPD